MATSFRPLAACFSLLILVGCGSAEPAEREPSGSVARSHQPQPALPSHLAAIDARRWMSVARSHLALDGEASTQRSDDGSFHIDNNCSVACYTRDVDGNIGVVGLFPLPGDYEGRICRPKGYADADISQVSEFSWYCAQIFPAECAEQVCWVGGDTGGFLGRNNDQSSASMPRAIAP